MRIFFRRSIVSRMSASMLDVVSWEYSPSFQLRCARAKGRSEHDASHAERKPRRGPAGRVGCRRRAAPRLRVEEVLGDVVLERAGDDRADHIQLLRRQLARTLVHVDLSRPAHLRETRGPAVATGPGGSAPTARTLLAQTTVDAEPGSEDGPAGGARKPSVRAGCAPSRAPGPRSDGPHP